MPECCRGPVTPWQSGYMAGIMRDDFEQQVREVLAHLHDYRYLQDHALATAVGSDGLAPRERMRQLRVAVIESIEELRPASSVSPYGRATRSYSILALHYVDRLGILQVALELSLSERQTYRDLRQAESELAAALWDRLREDWASGRGRPALPSRVEIALDELSRVPEPTEPVDLEALVQGSLAAVRRLAEQRDLDFGTPCIHGSQEVRANRHAVRQVLIGILSSAVQQAARGTSISVAAKQTEDRLAIVIGSYPEGRAEVPAVEAGILERLGGQCKVESSADGGTDIVLTFDTRPPVTVLVVDDNEGLVALFRRYLSHSQYRVVGARDGLDGIRKSHKAQPDIVILDVLMPGSDGWEVLEQLRQNTSTQAIPVVVCSVLDDPELAFSLGADGFLTKPVSRQQLLDQLSRFYPGRPDSHNT